MEPVPADAGLAERAGQSHGVGDVGVPAVERRVEAGHVQRRRVSGAGGAKGVEAPGLVEPVEGDERFESGEHAAVDDGRPDEVRAAVDDPVADGGRALSLQVPLEEPLDGLDGISLDRALDESDQRAIGIGPIGGVLQRGGAGVQDQQGSFHAPDYGSLDSAGGRRLSC